jgi:hypothetical protein
MALFAKGKQPTRVVKLYGVENLLVGLNLFMTAEQGYRVISSEHFELPWFHIAYERVTYERSEPPKAT